MPEKIVLKKQLAEDSVWSLVIAIIASIIEFFLFVSLVNHSLPPGIVLIAHGSLILFLIIWTSLVYLRGHDIRQHLLLTISTIMFSIIGTLGFITMWIIHRVYIKTAASFAEWLDSLFPEEELDEMEELYDSISLELDELSSKEDIIPFGDIMALGTDAQKQVALARMTRFFSPSFAPVLLNAIEDPSNSIRVQAATAIAKIEKEFLEQFIALEKKMKRTRKTEDIFKLAKHCDDYAHCGILDPDREQKSRKKAIELYQKYLDKRPNDLKIHMALGRAYLQDKQTEKAFIYLKKCVVDLSTTPPNVMMWYLECLYKLGKLSEIRKITQKYKEFISEDEYLVIKEVFHLWNITEEEKADILSWKGISKPIFSHE